MDFDLFHNPIGAFRRKAEYNYETTFKSLMSKQREEFLVGNEVTVKNALVEIKEMNE